MKKAIIILVILIIIGLSGTYAFLQYETSNESNNPRNISNKSCNSINITNESNNLTNESLIDVKTTPGDVNMQGFNSKFDINSNNSQNVNKSSPATNNFNDERITKFSSADDEMFDLFPVPENLGYKPYEVKSDDEMFDLFHVPENLGSKPYEAM